MVLLPRHQRSAFTGIVLTMWSVVLIVAVLAACAGQAESRKHHRTTGLSPPPLVGEDPVRGRKHKRPAECQFGGRTYELEDVWHPDLGPPFGVMYCVRCECLLLQRKRRVIGKVRCRNVKNDCAKPNCEEPILLPGQCCKTCPTSHTGSADDSNLIIESVGDDDKHSNEFATLLTGMGMQPPVATSIVGSGRLTFAKRNLHYSIYLGRSEPITHVRFVDVAGTIMEEQEIDVESHRFKSGKICGVWRRVPKIYRKLLRDGGLYIELVSGGDAEGVVRGKIARYSSLNKETFSALLRPPDVHPVVEGSGGLAVISSVSTIASTVHFILLFNGIVADHDALGTSLVLKVETDGNNRAPKILVEETLKVSRPNSTFNTLEFKVELSPQDLRAVLLGKTILSLAPKMRPEQKLMGRITPKMTCNVFQALLANANSFEEELPNTNAAGLALIHFNPDATISYMVYVQGLSSRVLALTLESTQKKRRQIIENVLPNFNDSWANGTYIKTSPRDIEMLFADEISVNVATEKHESELRGQVTQRLYSDAHASDAPILLRSTSTGTNVPALTGYAWLSVDSTCKLAYDVIVAGYTNEGRNKGWGKEKIPPPTLYLELIESSNREPGVEKRLLQDFTGNEVEDVMDDLSKLTLSRLDSGVTYLQISRNITSTSDSENMLQGRIHNVRVPLSCMPVVNDNAQETNVIPGSYKCYYEGKLFEDGSQWTAEHDSCMMCSCQRGRVICEPVICPKLHCNNIAQLSGECCPSCSDSNVLVDGKENTSRGCYLDGDKKWRPAGTFWHPYIPPFGFSRCAVCTCDTRTLKVDCQKITCPLLPCAEKDAIRTDPQACCKVCPVSSVVTAVQPQPTADLMSGDAGSAKNSSDILAEGGCEFGGQVYSNGQEWHPRLQPFGEEKCIKCSCKDGKMKCKRLKCPTLRCDNRVEVPGQCCQRCADGSFPVRYRHKGSGSKRRKVKPAMP